MSRPERTCGLRRTGRPGFSTGRCRHFVDGKLVFETQVRSPDVDQYIVLRMGGAAKPSWGGVPDATSEWPGVAEYDWVRVYQKA